MIESRSSSVSAGNRQSITRLPDYSRVNPVGIASEWSRPWEAGARQRQAEAGAATRSARARACRDARSRCRTTATARGRSRRPVVLVVKNGSKMRPAHPTGCPGPCRATSRTASPPISERADRQHARARRVGHRLLRVDHQVAGSPAESRRGWPGRAAAVGAYSSRSRRCPPCSSSYARTLTVDLHDLVQVGQQPLVGRAPDERRAGCGRSAGAARLEARALEIGAHARRRAARRAAARACRSPTAAGCSSRARRRRRTRRPPTAARLARAARAAAAPR